MWVILLTPAAVQTMNGEMRPAPCFTRSLVARPVRLRLMVMAMVDSSEVKAKRSGGDGEVHRSGRAGWLRAAVLGADDAIVSTASLMIGVAASSAPKGAILGAGVGGFGGGALSMGVGGVVFLWSQRGEWERG